ncbi:MAG: PAS domain-containing protein, partial [Oceanospirillum sp.]|nr:PAS domain-containing protein [Oceanospirillum sp.]
MDNNLEIYTLRNTLDHVGAYVFTKDAECRYTYANKMVCDLFGAPLSEIVGKTDDDFFDLELSKQLHGNDLKAEDAVAAVKAAGFDLVIAETAGIGQGDSSIADLVDLSIYVMTSEFGAASQLEKIDMLDFADLVVVNKFEKRGGEDAVRDVRKQVQR